MACRSRLQGEYQCLDSRDWFALPTPPADLVFHPQWTPGIGYLRQRDFSVKLLRPRKGPFGTEQDESLPPTLANGDGSEPHDPSALAETDDRPETCNVRLSICYSPSYGVPVLWLEAHKRGPPLSPSPLSAFLKSGLSLLTSECTIRLQMALLSV